jgi:hypothetical protein
MGYGGFFKSIVRIAVPAIVALAGGGPLAIAISSAATTGATGGSFKEALMSGVTSYIGASIGQNVNVASQAGAEGAILSGQIANGSASLATNAAGQSVVIDLSGNIIGEGAAAAAAASAQGIGGTIGGALDLGLSQANQAITGGLSSFSTPGINQGFGGFVEGAKELFKTPFDLLQSAGDTILGQGALTGVTGIAPLTPLGGLIGGAVTLTLNQALLANTLEADQLLADEGFTPQQIQLLKNEARNALSQETFERITGPEGATNPFGTDEAGLEEFQKVIAAGIERENVALGPNITEAQFRQSFDDPNLGEYILGSEEDLRRRSFSQEIEQAFPGDAFQPLDDRIIDSIIKERRGPAGEQISRFGARGNLNPTGGYTANLFLQRQEPEARERVGEIGAGVLGGYREDIGEIRGRATEQAGGYRLGEDLFDVAPFSEERGSLIEERQGTLGADVRRAIGGDPLFDVSGALRAGGRAQGVVSGQGQNQALLDQIAAREFGSASGRNRRSLGSRGSGAF